MALKLDISKAYDRVEWNFLEQLMEKLVLHSLGYFSIMVNGETYGFLQP